MMTIEAARRVCRASLELYRYTGAMSSMLTSACYRAHNDNKMLIGIVAFTSVQRILATYYVASLTLFKYILVST